VRLLTILPCNSITGDYCKTSQCASDNSYIRFRRKQTLVIGKKADAPRWSPRLARLLFLLVFTHLEA
jgi:hypothetical protein